MNKLGRRAAALLTLALLLLVSTGGQGAPASAGICDVVADPTCAIDVPPIDSGGGDEDIDLDVDLDGDGDTDADVDADINLDGDLDLDVDVDTDNNDVPGVNGDSQGDNDVDADVNTDDGKLDVDVNGVTEDEASLDADLNGLTGPDDSLEAAIDGVVFSNTDADIEVDGALEGDIIVARVCHDSSFEGSEFAFIDEAGNVINLLAEETGANNVYVGVNTGEPCSSAGPISGDDGDDQLVDGDVLVVGVCHASDAESTQAALIDAAGNPLNLTAEEFATNDILVAINTDSACPGSGDGSEPDDEFLDDGLVAVGICHSSGADSNQFVLVDELGNTLDLEASELAANEVLVAVNNSGLCPGDSGGSDGGGSDDDDDLLGGDDLIVVGICHVSEAGAEAIGFVDLLGNPVDLSGAVFDENSVLVLINTDEDCSSDGSGDPGDDGDDEDEDDGDDDDDIEVEICIVGELTEGSNILGIVNQTGDAAADAVLAVNVTDPCPDDGDDDGGNPPTGGPGDDDDPDDPSGDPPTGDPGDPDGPDGPGGPNDPDGPGKTGDPNEASASDPADDGDGSGGPLLNTGGFGLVADIVPDEPWQAAIFLLGCLGIAGAVGYVSYRQLRRRSAL